MTSTYVFPVCCQIDVDAPKTIEYLRYEAYKSRIREQFNMRMTTRIKGIFQVPSYT